MRHKDKRVNPATCHECHTYRQTIERLSYPENDPDKQYGAVVAQYHRHIAKIHTTIRKSKQVHMGISGTPID